MTFTGGSGDGDSILQITGNTTLSGTGTVTLAYTGSGTGAAAIESGAGSFTLTNDTTIQGAGTIGNGTAALTVINEPGGMIDANASGQTLVLNPISVTNGGTLEATGGGTLQIFNTTINDSPGGTIEAGASSTVQLAGGATTITGGGTVDGTGTIVGNFTLASGTITPGLAASSTPGTLTVDGNFTQSGGTFEELISTTGNGVLDVTGDVSLDGALAIDVGAGVTLTPDENFDFLDYDGTLTGAFTNGSDITADGWTWDISSYDSSVGATDPEVILTAVAPIPTSTPEPSGLPMVLVGLLALGALSIRKKKIEAER
jgi:fibronectin-binding autotransporter adhesin